MDIASQSIDDSNFDFDFNLMEPIVDASSSAPSPQQQQLLSTDNEESSLLRPINSLINYPEQPSSDAYAINADMIQQDQKRVDAMLQQQPSPSDSRKRKPTTLAINLSTFITLVWEIFIEMAIDPVFKERPMYKKPIKNYCDDFENKRMRSNDSDNILSSNNDVSETKIDHNSLKMSERKVIFQHIIMGLFAAFEQKNASFIFSKEMLKYFLATYSLFIKPMDFADTNKISKSDRRSKTTGQLVNGAILLEYGKSLDSFITNMSRSEPSDVEALKFILNHKIILPRKMYQLHTTLKIEQPNYIVDKIFTTRNDHSTIMISNFKRCLMLIAKNTVMMVDNNLCVIPTANIERDFNISLMSKNKLSSTDYVFLDVLLSSKTKVIDIVKYKRGNATTLPESYTERLKLITELFQDIKIVSISQPVSNNEFSYIHKPNIGYGPSYIYHRSNLTAAVVGTSDKHAVLAFEDKNNTLVIKTKASIQSPILYTITTSIYSKNKNQEKPTIKHNGIEYTIIGDCSDVNLYENVLPVECRECNKIAHLSSRPISHVSEYKPVTNTRESSAFEIFQKSMQNNPLFAKQVAEYFKQISEGNQKTIESIDMGY